MKEIIRNIFSRPIFQPLGELALTFILKVLNIGDGQSVQTSGEMSVCPILNRVCAREGGAKNVIVFDVGAHTGEWAGLFKNSYVGKNVVYSFEPSKESFKQLVSFGQSIYKDTFFAENVAMGEIKGEMSLEYDTIGSSGAHIVAGDVQPLSNNSELICVTTIDDYCKDHNIPEIDLLKLDIEGYEIKALKGAQKMISENKIKLIQFEFGAPSEEKYSMDEFFKILSSKYKICRILKHGVFPLKNYKHYYEIITVTNFLAIRNDLLY